MIEYNDQNSIISLIQQGNLKLSDEFIEKNTPLVDHIIKRYFNLYRDKEDLFQIGNMALMDAIYKYDVNMESKFSTFAYKYIYFNILNYIKNDNLIRTPHYIYELEYKVNALYEEYNKQGKNLTDEEIIKSLKITKAKLALIRKSKLSMSSLSIIDNYYYDKGFDDVAQENVSIKVEELLSTLTTREYYVIEQLFGLNGKERKTQVEIGYDLGLAQSIVSRLKQRALKKINSYAKLNY